MMLDALMLAAEADTSQLFPKLLPLITSIVLFLIFFTILAKFVWPKILGALDDRERKILGEIESAEQAREQAKAAQAEYEQSLAEARREASEMIAKAKADAKSAAEELRARNESELSEMKQRAAKDINAAKQSAINELHAEATTLAAAIAGKILQREVTAEDQQRLVEESLKELGRVQRN
jgi:F-type H+-transporting ATPase subunit b